MAQKAPFFFKLSILSRATTKKEKFKEKTVKCDGKNKSNFALHKYD
jgi:hypothetical protein